MDLRKYIFNGFSGYRYYPQKIDQDWNLVNTTDENHRIVKSFDQICELCNIPDDIKLLMKLTYGS